MISSITEIPLFIYLLKKKKKKKKLRDQLIPEIPIFT